MQSKPMTDVTGVQVTRVKAKIRRAKVNEIGRIKGDHNSNTRLPPPTDPNITIRRIKQKARIMARVGSEELARAAYFRIFGSEK
jgi:hypothetical protein